MVIIKNMFNKDLFLNRNFGTDSWAMNAVPKNCSRSTCQPRRAPADNKFRIAILGPKRRAHGTGTPFSPRSEIHCVGFIDQVDPDCNSVVHPCACKVTFYWYTREESYMVDSWTMHVGHSLLIHIRELPRRFTILILRRVNLDALFTGAWRNGARYMQNLIDRWDPFSMRLSTSEIIFDVNNWVHRSCTWF